MIIEPHENTRENQMVGFYLMGLRIFFFFCLALDVELFYVITIVL